jgi:hypothetical protein
VANVLGLKSVLSNETEDSLFDYCIDMGATYFGLSATDIRLLAHQLTISNGFTSIFAQNPAAGNNCPKGFFKYANIFLYCHKGFLLQNHIAPGNPDNSKFCLAAYESEFEASVPISTDDGAECIFSDGLFSQDKCGERRFHCTRCKK